MTPQMIESAEIRWFIPHALTEGVRNWFLLGLSDQTLQALKEEKYFEDKRPDNYLVLPGADSVGVKIRGGIRFEIKAQVTAPRPLVTGEVSGRTDQWVKWSFEHADLNKIYPAMQEDCVWVEVSKERYLRKLSGDSGALSEVPPSQRPLPNVGCNVELTRLELRNNKPCGYSIGFEAFGPAAGNQQRLLEALKFFFARHSTPPGVELNLLNSASYPSWILATQGTS